MSAGDLARASKRNDSKSQTTNASATKKQILSLPPTVGRGGDVPPLGRTTHLDIWFIFSSSLAFALLIASSPTRSPSLFVRPQCAPSRSCGVCSAGIDRGVLTITRARSNGCPEGAANHVFEFSGEHAQGCWNPKVQKRGELAQRTRSASILRPPYGRPAPEASVANAMYVSLANADFSNGGAVGKVFDSDGIDGSRHAHTCFCSSCSAKHSTGACHCPWPSTVGVSSEQDRR